MNRILGDELSVLVTDQFGNKLPMHQMVSLAYRTSNLIADIRRTKDEGRVHVLSDNLFASAPDIIADTGVFSIFLSLEAINFPPNL